MITTTVETPGSLKSPESLDKVFHVLFTSTMYLRLNGYAYRFGVSKGHMVREALAEHFQKIDAENRHDH